MRDRIIQLCKDVRNYCGREADISEEEINELTDDFIEENKSAIITNDFDNYSRRYKIIKNYGDGGNTPGIQGSTFRVDINTNKFEITDILITDRSRCYLQVKDKIVDKYIYTYILKLVDPEPTRYIPIGEISEGSFIYKAIDIIEE